MKERIDSLLSWANEQNRPKKILICSLVLLVLSGIFAVVREIYFPPKVTLTSIPNFERTSFLSRKRKNEKSYKK